MRTTTCWIYNGRAHEDDGDKEVDDDGPAYWSTYKNVKGVIGTKKPEP